MIFTLEPAVSAMPGIFSVRTCLPSSPLGQGPLVRLRHDGVFLKGHLTAPTPNRWVGPGPYAAIGHELTQ